MRLAQMTDNGGLDKLSHEKTFEDELLELDGKEPIDGLSLEACVSRFLKGRNYKHKQPYIDLMIERGGKKGDFHLLTREELCEYNLKDAEVTLYLYEELIKILAERGIDWSKDHFLYRESRCHLVTDAEINGVRVDFDRIDRHIDLEGLNINAIELKFRELYGHIIKEIEQEKAQRYIDSYKSEKYKELARKAIERGEVPDVKFKMRSSVDKARFFIDKLGLKPKFFTKTGAPTFGAKLLWQFGEVGEVLMGLGRATISKKQAENLKILAELDGRWHLRLSCASTRNGRLSGGGNY
jgi:hypothetical protein